MVQYDAAT